MGISNILALLGGVALFLFGMSLMGDGLKRVAGSKLETILYRLTSSPLKGLLLGAGVTAVIQSSSATSVMVVGFVNSGMMKVRQAISVILGAVIGTSITGWIICLSYMESGGSLAALLSTASISAIVAVVGTLLRMGSKKPSMHHLGDILLGFAVLMFGMQAMSGAVSPLKDSPAFIRFMTAFSNPLLGILAGALFTAVLQSASASVGILQALSVTGAIRFAEAFPLLLGIGIGAAVPVLLSAIGARTGGRRTAWSYLIVQILAALLSLAVYYIGDLLIGFGLKDMLMNPVNTAAVNTVFRVACALALLPLGGKIEKLLCRLIHESSEEREANADFDRLDERFLLHPGLAVEQTRLTMNAMAKKTYASMCTAISLLSEYNEEGAKSVDQDEDLVDRYEDKIGTYLMKLNKFYHAENVSEIAQEKYAKKIAFTEYGKAEMEVLTEAVKEILELSFQAFMEDDLEKARRVEPLEEHIDVLCDELKLRHVERLQNGVCTYEVGFIFEDLLTDFERVADHCSNIAIALIELSQNEFQLHDYSHSLKEQHSGDFDALYAQYAEKYSV